MVRNCRIETFTTFSHILSIMKDNTELASRKHDTMTSYFFKILILFQYFGYFLGVELHAYLVVDLPLVTAKAV